MCWGAFYLRGFHLTEITDNAHTHTHALHTDAHRSNCKYKHRCDTMSPPLPLFFQPDSENNWTQNKVKSCCLILFLLLFISALITICFCCCLVEFDSATEGSQPRLAPLLLLSLSLTFRRAQLSCCSRSHTRCRSHHSCSEGCIR